MEIRLLKNEEIDKTAWDECLLNSPGFELYMKSSYLDVAFPKWKALIAGNYQAIFPIFEKKILIWKSLRQPLFIGPCKAVGSDENAINRIFAYLPQLFEGYPWISVHISNDFPGLNKAYKRQIRKFQQLKLPEEGFIPDGKLKKNLKKAENSNLNNLVSLHSNEFIKGVQEHLLTEHKALNSYGLKKLNEILCQKEAFGGECIAIANIEEHFHAAQFFLSGNNKLYIILSFSTSQGRKSSALHALQTKLINKHLKGKGVLHFGGSNIERVAEYNYNYGAEDVFYIRLSRKKFPLNLFKN